MSGDEDFLFCFFLFFLLQRLYIIKIIILKNKSIIGVRSDDIISPYEAVTWEPIHSHLETGDRTQPDDIHVWTCR